MNLSSVSEISKGWMEQMQDSVAAHLVQIRLRCGLRVANTYSVSINPTKES